MRCKKRKKNSIKNMVLETIEGLYKSGTIPTKKIIYPGWKRKIDKLHLKGEALSQTIVKSRREEVH